MQVSQEPLKPNSSLPLSAVLLQFSFGLPLRHFSSRVKVTATSGWWFAFGWARARSAVTFSLVSVSRFLLSLLSVLSLQLIVSLANKYLLLTKFEVRTVSYGPSFFPLIYTQSAVHKSRRINEDP